MYIRIKADWLEDKQKRECIIPLSKITPISELRKFIQAEIDLEPNLQRLFYKGKELVDGQVLNDYSVVPNDVVVVMKRHIIVESVETKKDITTTSNDERNLEECSNDESKEKLLDAESSYYKIGDHVDVRLLDTGAWYEGTIEKILKMTGNEENEDKKLIFRIKSAEHASIIPCEEDANYDHIRPRSYYTYKIPELQPGMTVLANFNIDSPKERGFWYDFTITQVGSVDIIGTLCIGDEKIDNCNIKFIQEFMRIEDPKLLSEQDDGPLKLTKIKAETKLLINEQPEESGLEDTTTASETERFQKDIAMIEQAPNKEQILMKKNEEVEAIGSPKEPEFVEIKINADITMQMEEEPSEVPEKTTGKLAVKVEIATEPLLKYNILYAEHVRKFLSLYKDKPVETREASKDEVLAVKLPSGTICGVKLHKDWPLTHKSEAERAFYDEKVAKSALEVRDLLCLVEKTLKEANLDIIPDIEMTMEDLKEISYARDIELQRKRSDRLKKEADLLTWESKFRKNLLVTKAFPDAAIETLKEFSKIEKDLDALMFKKHPDVVNSVRRLRRYYGKVEEWDMSNQDLENFTKKAEIIRNEAEKIFNKIKNVVNIKEEKGTFWDSFKDVVADFRTKCKNLSEDEVLDLCAEPDSRQAFFDKLDKVTESEISDTSSVPSASEKKLLKRKVSSLSADESFGKKVPGKVSRKNVSTSESKGSVGSKKSSDNVKAETKLLINEQPEESGLEDTTTASETERFQKDIAMIEQAPNKEQILMKKNEEVEAIGSPKESFSEIKQILMYPKEGQGRLSINTEDYVCLAVGQFLNDKIIEFYLKYLWENLPPGKQEKVYIFSSFFYTRLTASDSSETSNYVSLTEAEKIHSRVKNWTKKINIFDKDFIVVPINENAHWFLAIICFPWMKGAQTFDGKPYNAEPKPPPAFPATGRKAPRVPIRQPCILIFDSLAGPSRSRVVSTLCNYLTAEFTVKMKSERVFNNDVIKGSTCKVPQQSNCTDCGLYLLQYVEQFFKKPITDYNIPIEGMLNWFDEIVITKKREDICNILKELMIESGADIKVLPDIALPTVNGALYSPIVARTRPQNSSSHDETPEMLRKLRKEENPETPELIRRSQTQPHSSDYSWPELEEIPITANTIAPRQEINILHNIVICPKRRSDEEAGGPIPKKEKEKVENIPVPDLIENANLEEGIDNVPMPALDREERQNDPPFSGRGRFTYKEAFDLMKFIITLTERHDPDSLRKLRILADFIDGIQ